MSVTPPEYVTRGEFQAALDVVKKDVETNTGAIGTLREEMAAVKADIANSERWFDHIDKRMDAQDNSLKWILRGVVLAIITFATYLAVYVLEHPH